ncbi:uncharacterized protein TNCT_667501 [Trichonephila clavata]|uniref:Uncharacterized protein n=1 Tax=Trichonephila clavata TaxID=2740835 RepID=A0A8X6KCJ9_TRICU|nr:uncharacterized protein TNCT_667501 [Trichonephila clavata]
MDSLLIPISWIPFSLTAENENGDNEEVEIATKKCSYLVTFYEKLLDDISERSSVPPTNISDSIQNIMINYRSIRRGKLPEDIDYNDVSNCLGYLYRYAACHTALVWVTLTKVFNSSLSSVLTPKFSGNGLDVMFLGGGPGNDFVGFLNALYGKHKNLFYIYVTVVDRKTGWNNIFLKTIEKLKQGDYGPASRIFEDVCVIPTFIDFDLENSVEQNDTLKKKLQSASIVFLVKFLSHVSDKYKLLVLQVRDVYKYFLSKYFCLIDKFF